jgi:hypothetical protein
MSEREQTPELESDTEFVVKPHKPKTKKPTITAKSTDAEIEQFVSIYCMPLSKVNESLKNGLIGVKAWIHPKDGVTMLSSGRSNERANIRIVDENSKEYMITTRTVTFGKTLYCHNTFPGQLVREFSRISI